MMQEKGNTCNLFPLGGGGGGKTGPIKSSCEHYT